MKRLPKKRQRISHLNEPLYYAWKLGTIGVPAALLTGRSLLEAGKESVLLVKNKTMRAALLRTGYSFFCWIVGIASYVATLFFLDSLQLTSVGDVPSRVYLIYLWAGIPIIIAAGIIQLFIRPIFILASADLYADDLEERKVPVILPTPPQLL